ncbi:MAG: PilZ domain-containing protein [Desulfobacterales bacterium]|nr:PilZ domain-containing protein [Desulfobacterales bacterium]
MNDCKDRREKRRSHFRNTVILTEKANGTSFPVRMCNASEDGLFFESDSRFAPGAQIYVMVPGSCDVDRAKVVWCREILDPDAPRYRVGATFPNTLVH